MNSLQKKLLLIALGAIATIAILPGTALSAVDPRLDKLTSGLAADVSSAAGVDFFDVFLAVQSDTDRKHSVSQLAANARSLNARYRSVLTALTSQSEQSQQSILQMLDEAQRSGQVTDVKPYWITNVIRARITGAYLLELANRNDVTLIARNMPVELIAPAGFGDSDNGAGVAGAGSNLVSIGIRELWNQGLTGEGRLIASIDTGVEGTHPALSQNWAGLGQPDASSYWFDPSGSTSPNDNNGHGTHVMGTLVGHEGADTIGLAPGAKWITAGVIDRGGTLGQTVADILDAFEWLADPDGNPNTMTDVPDVVCNSWGIPQGLQDPCDDTFFGAIDNLEALGIVCIFAAGNEGPSSMSIRHPANRSNNPLGCFAVGAIDMQAVGTPVASFSSRGPSACGGVVTKPELVAPGISIRSSYKGGTYKEISGTSMATPHVAAVALLLRQYNPNLTPEEIKQVLIETAIDVGGAGVDNATGYGLVNIPGILSAVPPNEAPQVEVTAVSVADPYNNLPDPGESFDVMFNLLSVGGNAQGVYARLTSPDSRVSVLVDSSYFGSLNYGAIAANTESPFTVSLDQSMPIGDTLHCTLTLDGDPGFAGWSYDVALVCGLPPKGSIVTIDNANLAFGVGNFGQLGFGPGTLVPADAPGFTSNATGQNNVLYEASLIVTDGDGRIVDAARTITPGMYKNDFAPDVSAGDFEPQVSAEGAVFAHAEFDDNRALNPIGLEIEQHTTTFPFAPDDRYVLVTWKVRNTSGIALDDVRVGLMLDWDLNELNAAFERLHVDYGLGFVRHTPLGPGPTTGIAFLNLPLSSASFIENEGGEKATLSDSQKLAAMNAGFAVPPTQYGDWAEIVSTGPFDLQPGAEIEFAVAMIEANSADGFAAAAAAAMNRFAGVTAADDDEDLLAQVPRSIGLDQNYPNPFNASTVITYYLPRDGLVSVELIDVLGRTVRHLVNEWNTAGPHQVSWDGTDDAGQTAASGVYFYRVKSDDDSRARKMMLLR